MIVMNVEWMNELLYRIWCDVHTLKCFKIIAFYVFIFWKSFYFFQHHATFGPRLNAVVYNFYPCFRLKWILCDFPRGDMTFISSFKECFCSNAMEWMCAHHLIRCCPPVKPVVLWRLAFWRLTCWMMCVCVLSLNQITSSRCELNNRVVCHTKNPYLLLLKTSFGCLTVTNHEKVQCFMDEAIDNYLILSRSNNNLLQNVGYQIRLVAGNLFVFTRVKMMATILTNVFFVKIMTRIRMIIMIVVHHPKLLIPLHIYQHRHRLQQHHLLQGYHLDHHEEV